MSTKRSTRNQGYTPTGCMTGHPDKGQPYRSNLSSSATVAPLTVSSYGMSSGFASKRIYIYIYIYIYIIYTDYVIYIYVYYIYVIYICILYMSYIYVYYIYVIYKYLYIYIYI